jgi:hypothetical protein
VNILDENIVANQRERLKGWRVSVRHIGYDIKKNKDCWTTQSFHS